MTAIATAAATITRATLAAELNTLRATFVSTETPAHSFRVTDLGDYDWAIELTVNGVTAVISGSQRRAGYDAEIIHDSASMMHSIHTSSLEAAARQIAQLLG